MATSKYSYNFWRREDNQNATPSLSSSTLLNEIKPEEEDPLNMSISSSDPPPEAVVQNEELLLDSPPPPTTSTPVESAPVSRPRRFIGTPSQIIKSVSRIFVRSKTEATTDDSATVTVVASNENVSSSSTSSGIDIDNEEEVFMEGVVESSELTSPTATESVKTYAKILEEENSRLRQFVQEVLPASEPGNESENLKEDLITIHISTITELQQQIKTLHDLVEDLEVNHRREQRELIKKHEQKIQDLQRQSQIELARIVKDNQHLIDDILNSYFEDMDVWRLEFERETQMTLGQEEGESSTTTTVDNLDTTVTGQNGPNKVALQLLAKFRELNPVTQGLVVAGIGIIGLVFGYYSWPFISWAWPRLVAFAARIEAADVVNVLTWLSWFIASNQFKEFKEAWEEGKPLSPILFQNFGPEAFSKILQLAPSLFRRNRLPVMASI